MLPVYCGIIGDEGVGKTSALLAYASNSFPEDPLPTTFEDYSCNVMVDDHPYLLTLHDTSITDPVCDSSVDVFLLVFSVTNKQSLENVQRKWISWLKQNYPNKPFVLAGNKIDERDSQDECICSSQGKRVAKAIGAFSYEEFSVKTQEGLREAFEKVINASKSKKQKNKRKPQNCTIL